MDFGISTSKIRNNSREGDGEVPPVEQAVVRQTVDSRELKAGSSAAERGGDDAVSMHFHFF
jgi:hypothetical protein